MENFLRMKDHLTARFRYPCHTTCCSHGQSRLDLTAHNHPWNNKNIVIAHVPIVDFTMEDNVLPRDDVGNEVH